MMMRKNPAVMCAVRKSFDDDARKLTFTPQELQSMMSAVVSEAIQRTRHVTDAEGEVNSLSAGRSGDWGIPMTKVGRP